jgi:glutamate synthase domain-containing protein 1
LDWSVVHNGEISSYGINRRYMEMHGYQCTMRTDTEVIAYAADLLMRRHRMPPEMAAIVLAPPMWNELDQMPEATRRTFRMVRQTYGQLLLNGPFTIILARNGEMMGLGDRVRLRPLVAGISGDVLYVSSELAAIHLVDPDVQDTWIPEGGSPVIGRLGQAPVKKVSSPLASRTIGSKTGVEQKNEEVSYVC